MTRKSIFSIVAVAVLSATQSWAQTPSFRILESTTPAPAGSTVFDVLVTPDTDGNSLAVEFGFDFSSVDNGDGVIDSQTEVVAFTLNDGSGSGPFGATFGTPPDDITIDNIGFNPFKSAPDDRTGTEFGVADGLDADQLFAAEGSEPLTGETLAFSFEINDTIGLGSVVSSLIAEDATVFNIGEVGSSAEIETEIRFGIFGDFDFNGEVSFGDFGFFAAQFAAEDGDELTADADLAADFNRDGTVTFGDFGAFSARFERDVANNGAGLASGVQTPEPSSGLLAVSILGVVCQYRRRKQAAVDLH